MQIGANDMKQKTSTTYRQRLTKVIDYIHDHIDQNLDVNTLADVAMMSPYHFHRIYREFAQETVNATVRRLRLQRAAVLLIHSEAQLSKIAKMVSYGSLEAFSRAFAKQFGLSPREYRKVRQEYKANQEPFSAMLPIKKKVYATMYTVELMNVDAIHVATYPHKGDYMAITTVFERLFMYGVSQNLATPETRSFGLYFNDPKSVDQSELRSKACVEIAADVELPGDDAPEKMVIPAGQYATLLFKGSYAELEKPYDWLFGEWLPKSGHEAADFPPMEEYLNDPKVVPPSELLTRIYCKLAN